MAIPCMFSSEVHLTLLFSLVFKKKSWRKFFSNNYYQACYRSNAFANCAHNDQRKRSAQSAFFIINTTMISALCVVFDCYDNDSRALCSFWLLRWCLPRSVLFFIVTMMISALFVGFDVTMIFSSLCVVFDCYDNDSRALCSFWLLRWGLARSVLFFVVTMMISALFVGFDWYHDV